MLVGVVIRLMVSPAANETVSDVSLLVRFVSAMLVSSAVVDPFF